MVPQMVDDSNRALYSFIYKNERAQSFEIFFNLLKKAVDTLTECGRIPYNANIVDGLQKRIKNPEFIPYMNALTFQNQIKPRTSNEILQVIATQILNLIEAARDFRRNASTVEIERTSTSTTELGDRPMQGAYTNRGERFIGSYTSKQ